MRYKLKKGTYDTYLSPDGQRMPRFETVKLKDLQVGDIIFEMDSTRSHYESLTVTAVRKLSKDAPELEEYRSYGSRTLMFMVTLVTGEGKTKEHGPVWASTAFDRQTTEAAYRAAARQDAIIAHRGMVRTLLGSCESGLGQRPKQKFLQGYWDALDGIRGQLEALELKMTVDAGRDPEKDKRNTKNRRGRERIK